MSRDKEVAIMANAIGYILYGGDQNESEVVGKYPIVVISESQANLALQAAERAWDDLDYYRRQEGGLRGSGLRIENT